MDIYAIGDENAILGFSLIGIEGETPRSVEEARSALEEAVKMDRVKIVLITESWAAAMRERVDQLKRQMAAPLVLEIPGSGLEAEGQSLQELVEEEVGIRVGKRVGG